MKRIVEVELETTAKKVITAINRFFAKHPELAYWKETFEYMLENGQSFFSDYYYDTFNQVRNEAWTYALHLDVNERIKSNDKDIYICIIERA